MTIPPSETLVCLMFFVDRTVHSLFQFINPETGESLERNQVGELCVRGPQNMKGYLNNEKATHEMIDKKGWLHTGYLFINKTYPHLGLHTQHLDCQ